jgi:hypothetical protein
VILAGKSRIIYLLDGAHLGGIGHQQATPGPAIAAIAVAGLVLAAGIGWLLRRPRIRGKP